MEPDLLRTLLGAWLSLSTLATPLAADSGVVPGIASTRDGIDHAYGMLLGDMRDVDDPGRRLRHSVAPAFPGVARGLAPGYHSVDVTMRIAADGTVDSAFSQSGLDPGPAVAALDSVSLRAAKQWRWSPSRAGREYRNAMFTFAELPDGAGGEGDLLLRVRENISQEMLPNAHAQIVGVKTGVGGVTDAGYLIKDIPAGQRSVTLPTIGLDPFAAQTIPVLIHAARCETLDVVLAPRAPVPPGYTYRTHPPAPLSPRAEDATRHPRAGFHFVYELSDGQEITLRVDSANESVYELEMSRADTTIHLAFTAEEVDRVYRKAIANRLFDAREPRPAGSGGWRVFPVVDLRCLLSAGGRTVDIAQDNRSCIPNCAYPSDDLKRAIEVETLIRELLDQHAEYRNLPPPFSANI